MENETQREQMVELPTTNKNVMVTEFTKRKTNNGSETKVVLNDLSLKTIKDVCEELEI